MAHPDGSELGRHHACAATHGGERRTLIVVIVTAAVMVVEIAAGLAFGSMALLADGWHMGTHAAALGIAVIAYRYTRRHAADPAYAFGPGKVNVLAGYTSALALAAVAVAMIAESVRRLARPHAIRYEEALAVAALGLAVNVACALLLRDGGRREHAHDHNLRGAYLHVLADAVTSLLAIAALTAGRLAGWSWLDPAMGLVGAGLILFWAKGLAAQTGAILLDKAGAQGARERLLAAIAAGGDTVIDLRVWPVCARHCAVALIVGSPGGRPAAHFRALVERETGAAHAVVEVRGGEPGCGCGGAPALVESDP